MSPHSKKNMYYSKVRKDDSPLQCPDTWQSEVATIETDTSEEVRDWRNGRFVSTDSTEAKYIKIAMTE
jgi:hypothetical protein